MEDSVRRSGLGWSRAGISWGMIGRDLSREGRDWSRAGRDENGTSTGRDWSMGLGGTGAELGETEAGPE